jgi:tetratricopeptide (TPR) repeat protein
MKQLTLSLFSFIFSMITLAELPKISSNSFTEKYNSAIQAYENKSYKNAETLFLELLKQDPESPELLQNLGLTYYNLDDKGRALTYFRSLSYLEPRDINIYKTIDLIESKLVNKNFDHDRSFLEDINLILLRWLKLPELLTLHFITFLFFGIFLTKHISEKKKKSQVGERSALFSPQLYAGLTFFIILTGLLILKISFENIEMATIISKNKITLKSGPSDNAADLYELFEGFEVEVESKFKDWAQISYQNQYVGWVKNSNIALHIK